MLITVWSVKGGVGATTVAVAAALGASLTPNRPVLLVDLGGDVPACLGVAEPTGPGLADWLAAGHDVPPDSLGRLAVPLAPGIELLARGRGRLAPARGPVLVQLLAATGRLVVVDAGNVTGSSVAQGFAAEADRSLLVTRACVLGVRRAIDAPVRPSGVVVVRDAGRALSTADVAAAVGAPVVAELAMDPAVARATDAGLARRRLPRSFVEAVASLLPAEARP
ncbi:MAG: ATPase involved in chromosome partitioning [Acidimicrobiales bacterium]|nr:ATPase involved in chromosome partitioning [Acidimicrobiales bacterium]